MKKGLFYLILIVAFLFLGSGVAVAVDFPSPPPIWESVDSFYSWSIDEEQKLFINRVYCFVINQKSIVNPLYLDNGFDYVYTYWLVQREDGQLVQDKFPNSYWFDANGDGVFSDRECLFEIEADGWNGNEVDIYTSEELPEQET